VPCRQQAITWWGSILYNVVIPRHVLLECVGMHKSLHEAGFVVCNMLTTWYSATQTYSWFQYWGTIVKVEVWNPSGCLLRGAFGIIKATLFFRNSEYDVRHEQQGSTIKQLFLILIGT